MLKLRLKTSDPENGAEVVEVPSGRVRHWACSAGSLQRLLQGYDK